jgi:hypothetical protein
MGFIKKNVSHHDCFFREVSSCIEQIFTILIKKQIKRYVKIISKNKKSWDKKKGIAIIPPSEEYHKLSEQGAKLSFSVRSDLKLILNHHSMS